MISGGMVPSLRGSTGCAVWYVVAAPARSLSPGTDDGPAARSRASSIAERPGAAGRGPPVGAGGGGAETAWLWNIASVGLARLADGLKTSSTFCWVALNWAELPPTEMSCRMLCALNGSWPGSALYRAAALARSVLE